MIPSFLPKQPQEVLPGRYFDFEPLLLTGEVISTATVTSSPVDLVEAGSVQWSGTVVSWTIAGGSDGDKVVFTIVATGDMGSVREREVKITVKDVAPIPAPTP